MCVCVLDYYYHGPDSTVVRTAGNPILRAPRGPMPMPTIELS